MSRESSPVNGSDQGLELRMTGSSMGVYQSCAEHYRLSYIEELEPVISPSYLYMGSAFHDCVEVFRETKDCTLSEMRLQLTQPHSRGELSDDDMCVLTAMVEAYYSKYRGEAGSFSEVEWEFDVPLGDLSDPSAVFSYPVEHARVAGKVDAISKSGDGHIIYETKTASRVDGNYLARLWHARQSLIYNWVLNKMGFNVQGVLYDIVSKPTIKRLRATPVEKRKYVVDRDTGQKRLHAKHREYDESDVSFLGRLRKWYADNPGALHRELIVHTPYQLEAIGNDVHGIFRQMWHSHSNQVFPRSLSSCHRFNRPCDFVPYCESGGSPLVMDAHYRKKEKQHAELS